jgi:hypothetical protein
MYASKQGSKAELNLARRSSNMHEHTQHNLTSGQTEELIANMAQEALQYVDRYYGSKHAISQSVHKQVDAFCKETHEPSEEEDADELFWGGYSNC